MPVREESGRMNIKVIDERGEKPCVTELNNVVNGTLSIVIGKDGGLAFVGDSPISYPSVPYQPYGPFTIQDCVKRA